MNRLIPGGIPQAAQPPALSFPSIFTDSGGIDFNALSRQLAGPQVPIVPRQQPTINQGPQGPGGLPIFNPANIAGGFGGQFFRPQGSQIPLPVFGRNENG